jgi:glucoamylase
VKTKLLTLAVAVSLLSGCEKSSAPHDVTTAPGAPGIPAVWSYSGKTGIGTSYEAYHQGSYSDSASTGTVSKVWFSIAQGILTETMYNLIHEAQLRELQFFVQGEDFVEEEKVDTTNAVDYLLTDEKGRPLSLAYRVTTTSKNGHYSIQKDIFTDPNSQSLMMRVSINALKGDITPYMYVDAAVANTGNNDSSIVENNVAFAFDERASLAVKTSIAPKAVTTGFAGVSDGVTELKASGKLASLYASTGDKKGNVASTFAFSSIKQGESLSFDVVLGFGANNKESLAAAEKTLARGYDKVLAHYNGDSEHIGWSDYLASLPALNDLSSTATDNGKLLYSSALVLKAQEDKTHAGALIASLSNPWGDVKSAENSVTGYKAVWPRDFYQVAMAMLALGDTETPKVAFEYLQKVQARKDTPGYTGTPGYFLQKTHVDGEIEWVAVQLDQTAMPIMLGWRLWKEGVLSQAEMLDWYNRMLAPAADFLVDGGKVGILWNDVTIKPPFTQQERWEEQSGYSPSTTAAIIAGLVSAAEMAELAGDAERAKRYLAAADSYSDSLEKLTFTTNGSFDSELGNGKYYLRINRTEDPNDKGPMDLANGQVINDKSQVIDGGFLELVRYGVRAANDPHVLETLPELDNTQIPDLMRIKYEFTFLGVEGSFPGWRRYGIDGYGEDIADGTAYQFDGSTNTPTQRGRVWPFFTGERGHYELERAKVEGTLDVDALRGTYVKGMELFANEGLMLPEQVFEGVGDNSVYNYRLGQGTNSATPLAWTHAEYVKLLRSFHDQKVWDRYPNTEARYVTPTQQP